MISKLASKDLSEAVKNYVAAAAMIVGGFWVLYQWDTLFPKTKAEVASAAATIRTDVEVKATVSLNKGEEVNLSGDSLKCIGSMAGRIFLVSGNLAVKSASAIPVRVTITRVDVSAQATPEMGAVISPVIDDVKPLFLAPVQSIPGDQAFLGGLSTNRVERGQSVVSSFIWSMRLGFPCSEELTGIGTEKLVAFKFNLDLEAIDPATGQSFPNSSARKVAVSVCQVTPRAYANCNLDELQAFGQ